MDNMDNKVRSQIDQLMDRYESKKQTADHIKSDKVSSAQNFHSEFKRIREEIIRPIFENMGRYIKQRGHDYSIEEHQESVHKEGITTRADIKMKIYPSGINRMLLKSHVTPSVEFHGDTFSRQLTIEVNTRVPTGKGLTESKGTYSLGEVTAELVEEKTLAALKDIFEIATP